MHAVAETFANLLPDVFPHTEDVAGGVHPHYLPVVRNTIESGMYRQPSFPIEGFYIEGDLHIPCIHVAVLDDDGIKLKHIAHR